MPSMVNPQKTWKTSSVLYSSHPPGPNYLKPKGMANQMNGHK